MDILLHIIGLCFIPLMLLLILSALNEIHNGLSEHFQIENPLILVKIRKKFKDLSLNNHALNKNIRNNRQYLKA